MTGRRSVAPNASIQQTTGPPPQETNQQPPSPRTSSQEAHDVRSYGPAEPVGRQLSSTPRGLGVQNILNTTEGDYRAPGVNTLYVPKTRGARESPQNQPTQQYQAHKHYPPAMTGSMTESFFERRPENRDSPPNQTPAPLLSPRRILSPRGPRSSSIRPGPPPHELDKRLQAPVAQAAPAKRPYEDVSSSDHLSGPASRRLPNSLPHTPNPPGASPARAASQPATQPFGTPHVLTPSVNPWMSQERGPVSPLETPHLHTYGINRSASTSGTIAPRPGQHGQPAGASAMSPRALGLEGSQAASLMRLPGYEHEPIEVHVDTSQGSRKASEKRERNAQASNRHRAKRRQMAQDDKKHIQQLQEEQEELERRIRDLMALADHYRADRNRLRDIVRATPAISDHAAGPPSPRTTEYNSGASPMLHHAPHGPGALRDFREHSSEASSMDRTAQRPMVEDRQEPYAHRHGSTTPNSSTASLPPGGTYMPLPRPTSASSSTGMGERLPSLRTLEGPPPPVADGRVWERDLRTGQWVLTQPRQYEMGWATGVAGPRRPHEGPQ
ncbi:uncharacterized protein F5Z01DRAFT_451337 [Emericellopsis atlantica]|uniref:BZIP domain-containing protein n=1 Tax=Emericellopsis atlantica TaxID=2614577 RepID=A0A9P8CTT0_9HYPO|nr:uncharacterized protein F5Z01DRAFT_451337 [Emericellopsis atlantica]KAG9257101.1 hypothetical protein F5Z01DRAFT_451337 [Emericellopsis atlantica]